MQVIPAITPLNGSLSVADARRLGPYLHASITCGVGGGVAVSVAEPATVPEAKRLNVCQKKMQRGEDSSIESHSWLCGLNICVHVHMFVPMRVVDMQQQSRVQRSGEAPSELGPETMTLGNVIPPTGVVRL